MVYAQPKVDPVMNVEPILWKSGDTDFSSFINDYLLVKWLHAFVTRFFFLFLMGLLRTKWIEYALNLLSFSKSPKFQLTVQSHCICTKLSFSCTRRLSSTCYPPKPPADYFWASVDDISLRGLLGLLLPSHLLLSQILWCRKSQSPRIQSSWIHMVGRIHMVGPTSDQLSEGGPHTQ